MLSSIQIWISSWKLVSTAYIALQNMPVLKMKAADSSQTSVTTYETRRCHSPVDHYLLNIVKISNLIKLRVSSALFTFFILGKNLYIYVLNNTINVTAPCRLWYCSIIYGWRLATQQRPPTVTNAHFIGYHNRILWAMEQVTSSMQARGESYSSHYCTIPLEITGISMGGAVLEKGRTVGFLVSIVF
jgi:hypothetical protein